LKERQAKFLKTKRVKKAYRGAHNNDNSHEGPSHKRTVEDHGDKMQVDENGAIVTKTPIAKEKVPKEEKEK
jgi:hypothetical protein